MPHRPSSLRRRPPSRSAAHGGWSAIACACARPPPARKTAKDGREGTIASIADGRVMLRWGPRKHEVGMYAPAELEAIVTTKGPALSAVAAWPFPMDAGRRKL